MKRTPGLALAFGLALMHCGSEPQSPTSSPTGGWPSAPSASTTVASNTTATFALDSLDFADESATSWGRVGFDLDDHVTDLSTYHEVCNRDPKASNQLPIDASHDGIVGVDNSFGAHVVPMLHGLAGKPTITPLVTDSIRRGEFSLQLRIQGLDGSRHQSSVGLVADALPSPAFGNGGQAPTFAPPETWPVRADLVADGTSLNSRYRFEHAYVNDGTFVSGRGELVLGATFLGAPIDLHLRGAIVVGTIEGDTMKGTIAGALDIEEFIVASRSVATHASATYCGEQFDKLAPIFRQTKDILLDGTNRAGVPCEATSFAVGFTAKRIANPVATASVTPIDALAKCK